MDRTRPARRSSGLACRPYEADAAFGRSGARPRSDPADPQPRVHLRLLREGALLPEEDEARCRAAAGARAR